MSVSLIILIDIETRKVEEGMLYTMIAAATCIVDYISDSRGL